MHHTIAINTLLVQLQVLRVSLLLSKGPSQEQPPWEIYGADDYASPAIFCAHCLIDQNPLGSFKVSSLCFLPLAHPTELVTSNTLIAAEKILLDPETRQIPQDPALRRSTAQRLIGIMEHYGTEPSQQLIKLAEKD